MEILGLEPRPRSLQDRMLPRYTKSPVLRERFKRSSLPRKGSVIGHYTIGAVCECAFNMQSAHYQFEPTTAKRGFEPLQQV